MEIPPLSLHDMQMMQRNSYYTPTKINFGIAKVFLNLFMLAKDIFSLVVDAEFLITDTYRWRKLLALRFLISSFSCYLFGYIYLYHVGLRFGIGLLWFLGSIKFCFAFFWNELVESTKNA